MNQCERITDYINRFGSITQAEAFIDLGVMRLAARISDIEKSGVPIKRQSESSLNRFGEKVTYTRYSKGESK